RRLCASNAMFSAIKSESGNSKIFLPLVIGERFLSSSGRLARTPELAMAAYMGPARGKVMPIPAYVFKQCAASSELPALCSAQARFRITREFSGKSEYNFSKASMRCRLSEASAAATTIFDSCLQNVPRPAEAEPVCTSQTMNAKPMMLFTMKSSFASQVHCTLHLTVDDSH